MTNSLFNFRDDEEREMFFVAIPVIALFTLLGLFLMKGETADVKTQSMTAIIADVDNDGVSDNVDQCISLRGTIDNYGCPVKTAWAERDNDNDGIRNGIDSCPETNGVAENNGCVAAEVTTKELITKTEPVAASDMDGDGYADSEDACPAIAGDNGSDCPADSDSDGVIDKNDKCIDQSGPAATEGCPVSADTDNDGVLDDSDQCPANIGTAATLGCPDRDADGVHDLEDQCPLVPGENNGCPVDSDADGIADNVDECLNEAGTEQNNGCPADADNDGIIDTEDNCPAIPGEQANAGCPTSVVVDVNQSEIQRVLDAAVSGVKFNSNSSVLTPASQALLQPLADLMRSYPDTTLVIRGHTDSSGNPDRNRQLSTDRARACADYITILGISDDRLTVYGLGDTEPLADNATPAGREQNRRVEFRLQ